MRDIKRKYHQAPQKRKVLKLESFQFEQEGMEDDDDTIDIHDVDFRITNDKYQVHVSYFTVYLFLFYSLFIFIFQNIWPNSS